MFSVEFLLLVLLYYCDGDMQISETAMIMQRVKSLTCNSDVNLSHIPGRLAAHHKWYQAYPSECRCLSECVSDCSAINLPSIDAFNTQYTVELHKFDNNTNIYTMLSVYNASNGLQNVFNLAVHCSGLQRKWISLVDDDYYRYQVDRIFTYGGSKSVKFNCRQYLHLYNLLEIQIGWITTAGDKIFTYKQTEIIMNLSDVHNGSMLCCLFYTTSDFKNGKHIKRFVKDTTLMIYQKETTNIMGQPGTSTSTITESYCENESNRIITTSSTTTPFITDTSNATGKNSNTTNKTGITSGTTTETSKYSGTTTETSKYSGTTNGTSKYSGTTNGTSKYSGTTNETSKYSGTTTKTSKYSGTTNETSKYSGTTTKTSKYSDTTNETSKYSGTTTKTSKYSGTTNETDQKTNNTNTTGKTTGATNRTDSSNHDTDATGYVIIIISSISAILVLLIIGICAIMRHCWKKTNRPKRAPLPLPQIPGTRLRSANEPDINTPFYLNLLFRRECELEIQAREEPHYEEVMYQ